MLCVLGDRSFMNPLQLPAPDDLDHKLKRLMLFRILFSGLLLGSSAVLQIRGRFAPLASPLLMLYALIAAIFCLSIIYALSFKHLKHTSPFAFIQISGDTLVVSAIIFVTGNYASIFSFLYLLVIIYASILLFRKGSMIIAALCSIQYGLLIDMEYFGILHPFDILAAAGASAYAWEQVLFKIIVVMAACFAVAFLSGLLSEQERKTKKELAAMEAHVKRVRKMAVMGEMAAGMAHEIKNPLASITGSIQLLKEDIPYHPAHDRLMHIILREADRLSSLVNDFLLFSRPPAGKSATIGLETTLQEIVDLFENDCACGPQVEIRQRYVPGIRVEMDPHHLRQIIWNLLLNAVEAIDPPGAITVTTIKERHNRISISIADTGCGIAADRLQSIFDPFFTSKPDGTGLGLSIAHSLLEAYGSRFDVESRPGSGTRFIFRLNAVS